MSAAQPTFRQAFERDGYAFPFRAISAAQAAGYRRQLEDVEARFSDDPALPSVIRSNANLVLPFMHEITLRPEILDPVSDVLGPDLLIWGCSLFIKEPDTPHYVSWHQDLTYWGLDDTEEVTAWLALSPALPESGCMRFVPGSHKADIVAHRDTFSAENQLSRGQELAVEVDETEAVDVILQPGEMSLHHGHTFHASHANRSADRRIGVAIRYITPKMKQRGGVRSIACLARGEDHCGHFELAPPPAGIMLPEDLARKERAAALLTPLLYAGAEDKTPKRHDERDST